MRLDGRTVNARASCVGDSGVQILHSVANGSPPLQHLCQVAVLPWALWREDGHRNSLHASA